MCVQFIPVCWTQQSIVAEGLTHATLDLCVQNELMGNCYLTFMTYKCMTVPCGLAFALKVFIKCVEEHFYMRMDGYTPWGKHRFVPIQTVQYSSVRLDSFILLHTVS